jgi:hypothetical protein
MSEAALKKRFVDDGRTVGAYADLFLVECPRCGHCTKVQPAAKIVRRFHKIQTRRVVCGACAYVKEWPKDADATILGYILHNTAFDWYFKLPPWLQTPCCGEVLFAFNAEHLSYIEAFMLADLRDAVHRNWSLASRPPKWIQHRHNRDDVLAGIERLRQRLLEV